MATEAPESDRAAAEPKVNRSGAFDAAIADHDRHIAGLGLAIWVGGEPTFTDRYAESAEWLIAASGPQKLERALAFTAGLPPSDGSPAILRTIGRQYPGEDEPRWSLGVYLRRDGRPIWTGPPDPMRLGARAPAPDLERLIRSLLDTLNRGDLKAASIGSCPPEEQRLVFTLDGATPLADPEEDPRLLRDSLHGRRTDPDALCDSLADDGQYLLVIRTEKTPLGLVACIELPELARVEPFIRLLDTIGRAASDAQLPALILAGYPPPVDTSVMWTTVTPDPAVLEVNSAPYPDVMQFLGANREIHRMAASLGLSPFRLHYNGDIADSGGGGQITLGGPSPDQSPFVREPLLLPRLIRYCNHHPALSYRFAHDYVGEWGQSVRADERGRESFAEMGLTLELLDRDPPGDPERLWRALAPFLSDLTGNSHRAELNIEKLWNPGLPGRGRMGVVEFRALRMQPSAERAAALAALLRAIVARLSTHPFDDALVDWGEQLHDRFALPFYLEQDLHDVFDDLERTGLGLPQPIRRELLDEDWRICGSASFEGCRITVRRALEFWPLVGDSASQEGGTSRLVDSSAGRIEIRLTADQAPSSDLMAWRLAVDGWEAPLIAENPRSQPTRLIGIRHRRFMPWQGLHPGLAPRPMIPLLLWRPGLEQALRIELHEWRPDNEAYDGLPASLEDARLRREARVLFSLSSPPAEPSRLPPVAATTACCLDLRRL